MDDEKFITTSHDIFPRHCWRIRMTGVVGKRKPKFDPNTLKPFDKVLARDTVKGQWRCTFYSHEREDIHKYVTTDYTYKYCIPHNDDTRHLVGTFEEAPEFYRYWES